MNSLHEGILKNVLPQFSNVGSDDSLVEKLHKFLDGNGEISSLSIGQPTSSAASQSSQANPRSSAARVEHLDLVLESNGHQHLVQNHAKGLRLKIKISKTLSSISSVNIGS